jgi:hypothetical protein
MLSLDHKAALLRKAGFPVPSAPRDCDPPSALGRADTGSGVVDAVDAVPRAGPCTQWQEDVDALFVAHSIARALRSLQQEKLRLRDAIAHYLPPQNPSGRRGIADR